MRPLEIWRVGRSSLPKPISELADSRPDSLDGAHSAVLKDAELLLRYTAENGLPVDPEARATIISARQEYDNKTLGAERITALYAAYTYLAITVQPVTVDTIRACRNLSIIALKRYRLWVLLLTTFVISLGVISFMSSAITRKIADDVTAANALAVKLGSQLGVLPNPQGILAVSASADAAHIPDNPSGATSPAKPAATGTADVQALPPGIRESDVITDLQQFAALIREIYNRALSLNSFVRMEYDPFFAERQKNPETFWRIFQLPTRLDDFRQAASDKIFLFQRVRAFGNDVQFDASIIYGAIGAYLLPVLYAVLGAFAYGLRKFASEIRSMTYHPSQANSARVVTAAICGAIVGLFSNFWQGISLPPLAIAFLVGYGVEVFFAFLDKLLETFGAQEPSPRSPRSPGPGGSTAGPSEARANLSASVLPANRP